MSDVIDLTASDCLHTDSTHNESMSLRVGNVTTSQATISSHVIDLSCDDSDELVSNDYFSIVQDPIIPMAAPLIVDLCKQGTAESDVSVVVSRNPSVNRKNRQTHFHHTLTRMGFDQEEVEYALARCSSVDSAVVLIVNRRTGIEPEPSPTFPCPICLTDFALSDMVTLSCLHRLCNGCFEGYCSAKISDGEVSTEVLVCPALLPASSKICGVPISIHEIKANVCTEAFDKYERFQTREFCEKQKMRSCPKCNEWFIDLSEALDDDRLWSRVVCGNCSHPFCGQCGLEPHKLQVDQDISCQAMAEWMEQNSQGETSLRDYMAANKIFPCPKCGMAAELSTGCKFLYCRCQARFCALCGVALRVSQHYSHFRGVPNCQGPFGNVCKGVTDGVGYKKSSSSSSSNEVAVVPPQVVAKPHEAPPVSPNPRKRKHRRK